MHRGIRAIMGTVLLVTSVLTLGAASGAPAPAHPPTGLVVDGRITPLNSAPAPSFGWLPHSAHGNDIQTAYEIVVRQALTGQRVWDSGRVASVEQSSVRYAGPSLAPGSGYAWTVRTWNRARAASAWAPPAPFDVGLGDHDWSGAQWIRRVTTGTDSTIDYTLARRQVTLADGGSPIRRARVYLATDGLWQLHVNGRVVDTQYDHAMPGEGLYAVADVTADAERARLAGRSAAGELAVGVLYGAWPTTKGGSRPPGPVPWHTDLRAAVAAGSTSIPVDSTQGFARGEKLAIGTPGTPSYDVVTIGALTATTVTLTSPITHGHLTHAPVVTENGPSGLLVKVVIEHADGHRQVLTSDPSWQVAKHTEEVTSTVQLRSTENAGTYVEFLDARLARAGWDRAGYTPGADWSAAVSLGAHPLPNPSSCGNYLSRSSPCGFTHLVALQSRLSSTPVHPVSVTSLRGGVVVADFGASLIGVPTLRLARGVAGRRVTLVGSYRLNHTLLTAAGAPGASAVNVASTCGFRVGDPVTVDAPADGYGAGRPEHRQVTATTPSRCGPGVLHLDQPLDHAHLNGRWVEGARVGRDRLDTQSTDLSFHYTERTGAQTTSFLVGQGLRYLQVVGAAEPMTTNTIWVDATHAELPTERAATFQSNNPTLNAVFALMQRSARNAAQQWFHDSPDRQDGQFLGDAVNESFATMESLGERDLTRQAIEAFGLSQQRYWTRQTPGPRSAYGAINAVYPTGDGKRDIPDFTEMYPEWVWRYYLLSGDRVTLERAYPVMQRIATYVTSSIATSGAAKGLVYELVGGGTGKYRYGIVDWPAIMRYDTTVLNRGVATTVNLRAVEVLRSVANAARVLGRSADLSAYRTAQSQLSTAINTKLTDPGGFYDDGMLPDSPALIGHHSQHGQSFAVAYGVAPRASYSLLGSFIARQGMKQGPLTLGQLEQSLIDVGRPDALVALLTNRTADGPAKILAQGGTSMWEQWDPGCYAPGGHPGNDTTACRGRVITPLSNDSFSHGWGSVGVVGILRGLLGVTTTSPGAATVSIAPPRTGLMSAEGTVWTERGPIAVSWSHHAYGFRLVIDVPDNVVATVTIPVAGSGGYIGSGEGHPVPTGQTPSTVTFRAGSGHTTFTPTPR